LRAVRVGQLLDVYGPLLTERQLQFMKLHYEEDLSFGEIAKDFGVSRQAIHDAVKHAEAALEEYEAKLQLTPAKIRRSSTPMVSVAEVRPTAEPAPGAPEAALALRAIAERLRKSGVLYNTDGLAKELSSLADQLHQPERGA